MRKKLGVNIDHVATIRQARRAEYPDPVASAAIAELAGADGITGHLREDRRHIQDRDILILRDTIRTRMNLEMAVNPEILKIALKVRPDEVCIVPERRQEVTTEGGLNVQGQKSDLKTAISQLKKKGILVSLFVDADRGQIEASRDVGADFVELHTGEYANARNAKKRLTILERIFQCAVIAENMGLGVNAGHGLNYQNVFDVALIDEIDTLNIGHSIIAQAVFTGLDRAVRDMVRILDRAAMENGGGGSCGCGESDKKI